MLDVEVSAVLYHISIKIRLKMNRERSEQGKIEKNKRFGHKKIIGPQPLGGARAGCGPPLDPLVEEKFHFTIRH